MQAREHGAEVGRRPGVPGGASGVERFERLSPEPSREFGAELPAHAGDERGERGGVLLRRPRAVDERLEYLRGARVADGATGYVSRDPRDFSDDVRHVGLAHAVHQTPHPPTRVFQRRRRLRLGFGFAARPGGGGGGGGALRGGDVLTGGRTYRGGFGLGFLLLAFLLLAFVVLVVVLVGIVVGVVVILLIVVVLVAVVCEGRLQRVVEFVKVHDASVASCVFLAPPPGLGSRVVVRSVIVVVVQSVYVVIVVVVVAFHGVAPSKLRQLVSEGCGRLLGLGGERLLSCPVLVPTLEYLHARE